MPKLKPETQQLRRASILDAAEACFATSGFHKTTMQDICKAAGISPGALYLYFPSKEDLIAGICERERLNFDRKIMGLSEAPDFIAALEKIAQHYFVEESAAKRLVAVEMGVEATRNPKIASICHALECNVANAFRDLFQRLKDDGRITPALPIDQVTEVFQIMGDGLFFRRAVVRDFDARRVLPAMMLTLQDLLKPVAALPRDPPTPALVHIAKTPARKKTAAGKKLLPRKKTVEVRP